jgi:hypothetical protein
LKFFKVILWGKRHKQITVKQYIHDIAEAGTEYVGRARQFSLRKAVGGGRPQDLGLNMKDTYIYIDKAGEGNPPE